jgi:hypothetical protein
VAANFFRRANAASWRRADRKLSAYPVPLHLATLAGVVDRDSNRIVGTRLCNGKSGNSDRSPAHIDCL